MIVWVKIGVFGATQIDVKGSRPYFDNLKKAIKSGLPNKFLTADLINIVIIDPSTNLEVDSTEPLTLELNGIERGTVTKPFIVEDPQQGILENAYLFLCDHVSFILFYHSNNQSINSMLAHSFHPS